MASQRAAISFDIINFSINILVKLGQNPDYYACSTVFDDPVLLLIQPIVFNKPQEMQIIQLNLDSALSNTWRVNFELLQNKVIRSIYFIYGWSVASQRAAISFDIINFSINILVKLGQNPDYYACSTVFDDPVLLLIQPIVFNKPQEMQIIQLNLDSVRLLQRNLNLISSSRQLARGRSFHILPTRLMIWPRKCWTLMTNIMND